MSTANGITTATLLLRSTPYYDVIGNRSKAETTRRVRVWVQFNLQNKSPNERRRR